MLYLNGKPRLPEQSYAEIGILTGDLFTQEFQCAQGIEQGVFDQIDFTHAADTETTDYPVLADDISGLTADVFEQFFIKF